MKNLGSFFTFLATYFNYEEELSLNSGRVAMEQPPQTQLLGKDVALSFSYKMDAHGFQELQWKLWAYS